MISFFWMKTDDKTRFLFFSSLLKREIVDVKLFSKNKLHLDIN